MLGSCSACSPRHRSSSRSQVPCSGELTPRPEHAGIELVEQPPRNFRHCFRAAGPRAAALAARCPQRPDCRQCPAAARQPPVTRGRARTADIRFPAIHRGRGHNAPPPDSAGVPTQRADRGTHCPSARGFGLAARDVDAAGDPGTAKRAEHRAREHAGAQRQSPGRQIGGEATQCTGDDPAHHRGLALVQGLSVRTSLARRASTSLAALPSRPWISIS